MILQEANTIRNDWQMRSVMHTYYDDKGFIQSIILKIRNVNPTSSKNLCRDQYHVMLPLESKEESCQKCAQIPAKGVMN